MQLWKNLKPSRLDHQIDNSDLWWSLGVNLYPPDPSSHRKSSGKQEFWTIGSNGGSNYDDDDDDDNDGNYDNDDDDDDGNDDDDDSNYDDDDDDDDDDDEDGDNDNANVEKSFDQGTQTMF